MFSLDRRGDGSSDPLGVKAITCHLNERDYRTRAGARFGVATIHGNLTNRVDVAEWVFDRRCSRTLIEKPKVKQITITVPADNRPVCIQAGAGHVGGSQSAHDAGHGGDRADPAHRLGDLHDL